MVLCNATTTRAVVPKIWHATTWITAVAMDNALLQMVHASVIKDGLGLIAQRRLRYLQDFTERRLLLMELFGHTLHMKMAYTWERVTNLFFNLSFQWTYTWLLVRSEIRNQMSSAMMSYLDSRNILSWPQICSVQALNLPLPWWLMVLTIIITSQISAPSMPLSCFIMESRLYQNLNQFRLGFWFPDPSMKFNTITL